MLNNCIELLELIDKGESSFVELKMVSSLFNLDRLEIIFYTADRKVKYF